MASNIILKKSSVASKVPLTTDLEFGELALNYTDGKLYYKKSDGTTIDSFGTGSYSNTSVDAHLNTATATTGQVLSWTGTDYDWVGNPGAGGEAVRSLNFIIDGGGRPITTGRKGYAQIDFNCTVMDWYILGDVTGSIVVDVRRATYAAFPTTSSIAGTEKPQLVAGQKNQDLTLTSWNTNIAAGDILEFFVESTSGSVTQLTVSLTLLTI